MEAASKSIRIFYIPMLVVLGLVTYVPALTLCFRACSRERADP
jgi:TRAP-type C4-dicarboxylate transport system permease large subunit